MAVMLDGVLVTILIKVLGWFASFTTTLGSMTHTLTWFESVESTANWEPAKAFKQNCVFALVNGE